MVKTIGDAVMATFPAPDRALAAALRMREAIGGVGSETRHEDLLLKIGIHEGPCLAVMLNDRLDYFGQTVNIAARVQGLARRARHLRHQAGGRASAIGGAAGRPPPSRRARRAPRSRASPAK